MKLTAALRPTAGAIALTAFSSTLLAAAPTSTPAQKIVTNASKRAQAGNVLRSIDRKIDAPLALAAEGAKSVPGGDLSGRRLRERLLKANEGLFARYSEISGRPRIVYGDLGTAPEASEIADRARIFLSEEAAVFGVDVADLEVARTLETPGGKRAYFAQKFQGLPVFYGEVAVHFDNRDRVAAVTNTYVPVAPQATTAEVAAERAFEVAVAAVGAAPAAVLADLLQPSELGIWPTADGGRLAWRVVVPAREPAGAWEVIVDARSGSVLEEPVSLTSLADGQARVFQPNPIVSENNPNLSDQSDSGSAVPSSAFKSVTLTGLDGSGKLVGTFSQVHPNMANPAVRPSFDYTDLGRSDNQFNETQVYWSIQRAQEVFAALGYGPDSGQSVMNFAIRVYPHDSPTWGNQDNSSFSATNVDGTGTGVLEFGTGGVDDAEDAEIVWHEYGHAMLHNQRPGISQNINCEGLGEGFGDYLAVSLSRRLNDDPRYLPFVGEWDATSYSNDPVPYLRRVDEPQTYPNTGGNCQVHIAGQTWSHALFAFENAVGADVALRTVLEANFLLDLTPTQVEAAQAMLLADESLTGGANRAALLAAFSARGILAGDLSPAVSSAQVKKTDNGLVLVVNGSGFASGSAVIEVDGTALGSMKYPRRFTQSGVSTRIQSGDRRIKSLVPKGGTVALTVLNPSTGTRSAAFAYTRP